MVWPPPRSQLVEAGGLGLPWQTAKTLRAKIRPITKAIFFSMGSPFEVVQCKRIGRLRADSVSAQLCPTHPRGYNQTHAGIRRKAGRIRALRDDDGRSSRPPGGHHGHDHRCHGPGRPAWRVLSKPALAGQTSDGYSDHHEESHRRKGANPERDGRTEKAHVVPVYLCV